MMVEFDIAKKNPNCECKTCTLLKDSGLEKFAMQCKNGSNYLLEKFAKYLDAQKFTKGLELSAFETILFNFLAEAIVHMATSREIHSKLEFEKNWRRILESIDFITLQHYDREVANKRDSH